MNKYEEISLMIYVHFSVGSWSFGDPEAKCWGQIGEERSQKGELFWQSTYLNGRTPLITCFLSYTKLSHFQDKLLSLWCCYSTTLWAFSTRLCNYSSTSHVHSPPWEREGLRLVIKKSGWNCPYHISLNLCHWHNFLGDCRMSYQQSWGLELRNYSKKTEMMKKAKRGF